MKTNNFKFTKMELNAERILSEAHIFKDERGFFFSRYIMEKFSKLTASTTYLFKTIFLIQKKVVVRGDCIIK